MKRCAVLAVSVVAGVLTACGDGGGGGGGEPEDPLAQADAACVEAQQRVAEINLEQGYDTTPKQSAEKYAEIVPVRAEASATIAALEAPADSEKQWTDFVRASEDQTAELEALLEAFRSGDQAKIDEQGAATSKATDRTEVAAEKAGLEACARVLPDTDRTAAEDALREFATTNDPVTSCEYENDDALVTEVYVEESVGGIEACTKDQKAIADQLATDIEVSDAEGVEGVSANVTYEDVGGKYDGEPITAIMLYVDGGWRLHQFIEPS